MPHKTVPGILCKECGSLDLFSSDVAADEAFEEWKDECDYCGGKVRRVELSLLEMKSGKEWKLKIQKG